jgi:SAM-dependent methyltransferase
VHQDAIRHEFTHQASSFGNSPAMTSAETLGALIELVPEDPAAVWLEMACGPGLISRAMSPKVGSVVGVDLTEAMLREAERSAREEGIENLRFVLGDATLVDFEDASFDGAITRFSFHHIPAPIRVFREMARVVRPGGYVVIGDQITDDDPGGAAWHQEIERLRDPTHWASQRLSVLREMGGAIGLQLEEERLIPIDIDFDEWLGRGSGGPSAASLIDQLLSERPQGAESFQVVDRGEGRRLLQRYWLSCWRRQ